MISIRTYVWAILGSQSQSRSSIIYNFDTQKQFLSNIEDSIYSSVDIPSSIQRYQNVLKYASKKLDYVVGFGLYMIPSDLNLKIGILSDYNNNILLAQPNFSLGTNHNINTKEKRSVEEPTTPTPPIVKRTVTEDLKLSLQHQTLKR